MLFSNSGPECQALHIVLAGPPVLSAVGACPPHDGVRRRWWINVESAVALRALAKYRAISPRRKREYFRNQNMPHRDRTGWLAGFESPHQEFVSHWLYCCRALHAPAGARCTICCHSAPHASGRPDRARCLNPVSSTYRGLTSEIPADKAYSFSEGCRALGDG